MNTSLWTSLAISGAVSLGVLLIGIPISWLFFRRLDRAAEERAERFDREHETTLGLLEKSPSMHLWLRAQMAGHQRIRLTLYTLAGVGTLLVPIAVSINRIAAAIILGASVGYALIALYFAREVKALSDAEGDALEARMWEDVLDSPEGRRLVEKAQELSERVAELEERYKTEQR